MFIEIDFFPVNFQGDIKSNRNLCSNTTVVWLTDYSFVLYEQEWLGGGKSKKGDIEEIALYIFIDILQMEKG